MGEWTLRGTGSVWDSRDTAHWARGEPAGSGLDGLIIQISIVLLNVDADCYY